MIGEFFHSDLTEQNPEILRSQKWRVALYSHDTMGIGHMRRNLLIAQTLVDSPIPVTVLLLAGAPEAKAFPLPPGVDCMTLPALRKDLQGRYHSRSLDLAVNDLVALRGKAILSAIEAFVPDVLIVDKEPRGALHELDATLDFLHSQEHTRCILGLRDVLDDPETVRREWEAGHNEDVISKFYDSVWVYGDPAVYDPVREYGLARDVACKVRFCGYLHRRKPDLGELQKAMPPAESRIVLCMVGGGQDGGYLAETFAQAELPPNVTGVILTGPFMPKEIQERLRARSAANPRLRVLGFVTDPDLFLCLADRVVTMGGYNCVYEVLAFEKNALVVPRVKPRREQLIRAERLRDLGLLEVLHPDRLSPAALSEWLARDLGPTSRVRAGIDLNGIHRLPQLLGEVLTGDSGAG